MSTTSKNGKNPRIRVPALPKEGTGISNARQMEDWLRHQGFKPVTPKTKAALKKAGCWGMPPE